MSEFVATVTSKGQITIPVEIRRSLKLHPGDQIVFKTDDDHATIRRSPYTLEESFGSVPALTGRETGDFDELIEEALQDHADWVVERMRRGEE
jgi:antitoxin PrlF